MQQKSKHCFFENTSHNVPAATRTGEAHTSLQQYAAATDGLLCSRSLGSDTVMKASSCITNISVRLCSNLGRCSPGTSIRKWGMHGQRYSDSRDRGSLGCCSVCDLNFPDEKEGSQVGRTTPRIGTKLRSYHFIFAALRNRHTWLLNGNPTPITCPSAVQLPDSVSPAYVTLMGVVFPVPTSSTATR